jgi:hypothetical protein
MGREAVGQGATTDERVVGEGARMNERPRCYVGHWADKDERVGIRFSISERDGQMEPTPAVTDGRPWLIIIVYREQMTASPPHRLMVGRFTLILRPGSITTSPLTTENPPSADSFPSSLCSREH